MATNQRRRERYHSDPDYRQRRIQAAWDRRKQLREERNREKRMRGWYHIDTAPENEVIALYDPKVFWPVWAEWDAGAQNWKPIHYEGVPLRPTHWRPMWPLPLT